MKTIFNTLTILLGVAGSFCISAQEAAELDTLYIAPQAKSAMTIDGVAESQWDDATWDGMNYLWMNYDKVDSADYYGRYKAMWDENYLYLLIEVTDDSLSDPHPDPLVKYYEDDCVEIFLDPDMSGGDHQSNFNAWAYHVSLSGDVVDYGTDKKPHLFNDHLQMARTTSGDKSVWEFAVKVYGDDYILDSVNTPLTLSEQTMGFSLAYCDNDELYIRENFMGSVNTPGHIANEGYIDASVFGRIQLVEKLDPAPVYNTKLSQSDLKPLPQNQVQYLGQNKSVLEFYQITGELLLTMPIEPQMIVAPQLSPGKYLLRSLENPSLYLNWVQE